MTYLELTDQIYALLPRGEDYGSACVTIESWRRSQGHTETTYAVWTSGDIKVDVEGSSPEGLIMAVRNRVEREDGANHPVGELTEKQKQASEQQEFDPEMIPCPDCENGEVSYTYADVQGSGLGMSMERAANMAGAHHHWETCERCGGKGEIEAMGSNADSLPSDKEHAQ